MDDLREILENKLETKQKEYEEKQQYFLVFVENERSTGCFERNAISDLFIMLQLKSEISQLQETLTLIKLIKK